MALKHARRSAAIPGRIPHEAWMVLNELLPVLHGPLKRLMAGRVISGPLNDSLFAFLPKGAEPLDACECIGGPSQIRPLSPRRADSSVLAAP
eukprot:91249-Pyramimonas_sp.AAC.1